MNIGKVKELSLMLNSDELTKFEMINESLSDKQRDDGILLRMRGVFATMDIRNDNGRTYNKRNYDAVLEPFMKIVNAKAAFGALEHRQETSISTDTCTAFRIDSIEWDAVTNSYVGEISIMDTPDGQKLAARAKAGSPVYLSSRALGKFDKDGHTTLSRMITYDAVGQAGFGINCGAPAEFEVINESLAVFNLADLADDDKLITEALSLYGDGDTLIMEDNNTHEQLVADVAEKVMAKLLPQINESLENSNTKLLGQVSEYINENSIVNESKVGLSDDVKAYVNESLIAKRNEILAEVTTYLDDELIPNLESKISQMGESDTIKELIDEHIRPRLDDFMQFDEENPIFQKQILPMIQKYVEDCVDNGTLSTLEMVDSFIVSRLMPHIKEVIDGGKLSDALVEESFVDYISGDESFINESKIDDIGASVMKLESEIGRIVQKIKKKTVQMSDIKKLNKVSADVYGAMGKVGRSSKYWTRGRDMFIHSVDIETRARAIIAGATVISESLAECFEDGYNDEMYNFYRLSIIAENEEIDLDVDFVNEAKKSNKGYFKGSNSMSMTKDLEEILDPAKKAMAAAFKALEKYRNFLSKAHKPYKVMQEAIYFASDLSGFLKTAMNYNKDHKRFSEAQNVLNEIDRVAKMSFKELDPDRLWQAQMDAAGVNESEDVVNESVESIKKRIANIEGKEERNEDELARLKMKLKKAETKDDASDKKRDEKVNENSDMNTENTDIEEVTNTVNESKDKEEKPSKEEKEEEAAKKEEKEEEAETKKEAETKDDSKEAKEEAEDKKEEAKENGDDEKETKKEPKKSDKKDDKKVNESEDVENTTEEVDVNEGEDVEVELTLESIMEGVEDMVTETIDEINSGLTRTKYDDQPFVTFMPNNFSHIWESLNDSAKDQVARMASYTHIANTSDCFKFWASRDIESLGVDNYVVEGSVEDFQKTQEQLREEYNQILIEGIRKTR